ncbi:unnamed protein product [Linum trigynum]|uniref:Uncharacterized protein n=1 Tax=Linum trigynum TaxID=586398 RepID=A0AAV2FW24_9ROSI
MSLSSFSLTEIFSEPHNGSFSVPNVGTVPAQTEIAIKKLQQPSKECKDQQEVGRHNPSPTQEILTEIGQGMGRFGNDIKRSGIWKPPDVWIDIF